MAAESRLDRHDGNSFAVMEILFPGSRLGTSCSSGSAGACEAETRRQCVPRREPGRKWY